MLHHVLQGQEVLLALQGRVGVAQRQVRQAQVAVRAAHGLAVLQVLRQGQVLVLVSAEQTFKSRQVQVQIS